MKLANQKGGLSVRLFSWLFSLLFGIISLGRRLQMMVKINDR